MLIAKATCWIEHTCLGMGENYYKNYKNEQIRSLMQFMYDIDVCDKLDCIYLYANNITIILYMNIIHYIYTNVNEGDGSCYYYNFPNLQQ